MHDMTVFQRDLLFVFAGLNKPRGLRIKGEIEEYYGDEVRHGRLYPNLDSLVDLGLVENGQKEKANERISNCR